MSEFRHISVLLNETVEALGVKSDGIYMDGTLGGGGHSLEIAKRLEAGGHLYGFDQDEEAILAATKRLEAFSDRVTIIKDNFRYAAERLNELSVDRISGAVLDLGVSSHQIDTKERGFSYMYDDAPLDMRMDTDAEVTAEEIINTYSEAELFKIFKEYGEEKYSKNIAAGIVRERETAPIKTAGELNRIIEKNIPAKARNKNGHPSKRIYQALRIECNDELGVLKDSISKLIDILDDKGRLAVITFHSLEDRIVKNAFKTAEDPCECPKSFPVCVCGKKSKGRIVTRHPITPSEEEISNNKRAKSAKLRVFERVII